MTENQFWNSTPKQLDVHVAAFNEQSKHEHQLAGWVAWNTAALHRCKRMPKLSKFLEFKNKETMTPDAQLKIVEALNSAFGGKDLRK